MRPVPDAPRAPAALHAPIAPQAPIALPALASVAAGPPSAASRRPGRSPLREPTGPYDFFLGVLALASLLIFLLPHLRTVGLHVPDPIVRAVPATDIVISAIFALDLVVHLARSPAPLTYLRQRFYEPFAAVPLTLPVISQIQVLLVIVVTARFVRAANVVFGDRFVESLIHRYSGLLVREVSDAVLLRSLALGREVVARGRFAKSIADALDRRRGELHGIVQDSLSNIPAWEALSKVPGSTEIIERTERLVIDATLDVMRSERLNVLIANVIDDSIEDFLIALREKHPELDVDALGPTERPVRL